jgi:DNA-binding LacI/PurR family transcriptional regulator
MESRILVLLTSNPRLYLGGGLYDALLIGILRGAGELSVPVVVAYDSRLRRAVPAELLEDPLRGIVIVGKIGAEALRGYQRLRIPVVLADHPGGNWNLHAACVDNQSTTHAAIEKMMALGHRRIAFVRRLHTDGVYDVDPDSRERQKAFVTAMEKAGVRAANLVFSFFSKDSPDASGIQALFARKPAFSAVLTSDAQGAGLVREAAARRGLNVPRDLSIVTYGAMDGSEPFYAGPRFDFRALGQSAALLTAAPRSPPQRVAVPGIWAAGKTLAVVRKT